ncbi:CoA-binding protein [Marinoscillum pacificum]|uniref:CoA-binding protein n=1 Tax=Marinoscillum pacificum TaxID=392723 RepID=UPI002158807D|nr:CoA-binding protein [Marinoscillum pacificum]
MSKKTVIIGATPNPTRYAYFAAGRLKENNHEIVPIGIKKGEVFNEEILDLKIKPAIEDVDTVTLYIGPQNQPEWEEYILDLNPKRIIFNPGTENPELAQKAESKGIEALNACTLVMLSANTY